MALHRVILHMSEDVNELQKEWRAIVLDKLNKQEENLIELRRDIADLKSNYVPWTEFVALQRELQKLKEFKAKAIGLMIGLNSLVGIIGWSIQAFLRYRQH